MAFNDNTVWTWLKPRSGTPCQAKMFASTVTITETLLRAASSASDATITTTTTTTQQPSSRPSVRPMHDAPPSAAAGDAHERLLASLLYGPGHPSPCAHARPWSATSHTSGLSAPTALLALLVVLGLYWAFKHLNSDEWGEWTIVRWWRSVSPC